MEVAEEHRRGSWNMLEILLTCIPIYCNCTFDDSIIRACNFILSNEMIIILKVFQVSQNRRNMIWRMLIMNAKNVLDKNVQ